MKKVKAAAGILCFLLMVSGLSGQNARHDPADVIVLMDTSGTVLPYYEAINKRVLQSIIAKFIRIEDVFHLLSFSAVPRYEMSQKINTEADLSRVVSRFMLLYQLGQSADFLSGINFAEQYMNKLPMQQDKILIVISDGIFNPPSSSPYRRYTGEQVKTELAKVSAAIRAKGWKVYYVKLPFPSDAVIKDLDGAFYAGKINAVGEIDRDAVDTVDARLTASGGAASAMRMSGRSTMHDDTVPSNQTLRESPAVSGKIGAIGAPRAETRGSAAAMKQNDSLAGTAAGHGDLNEVSGSGLADTGNSSAVNANSASLYVADTDAKRIFEDAVSRSGTSADTARVAAEPHTNGAVAGSNIRGGTAFSQSVQDRHAASNNGYTAGDAAVSISTLSVQTAGTDQTAAASKAASALTEDGSAHRSTQDVKEYTDVSQVFTENLGIEASRLPAEGSVTFNDDVLLLPRIVFPNEVQASGYTFRLPLTVINEAAEPIEITFQSISIELDGVGGKQTLENQIVRVEPHTTHTMRVAVTVPDSVRGEGSRQALIRLDMLQRDKPFSQAGAVLLTVTPKFAGTLLAGYWLWGVAALCLAALAAIGFIIVRRRTVAPVRYTAGVGSRQPTENRQKSMRQAHNAHGQFDTHETAERTQELHHSIGAAAETNHYSESAANATDPRESLNTFSAETAAATAITQQETALQLDYLAQEHSRNMEGRFALLNTANSRMSRRPGFGQHHHSGHISQQPPQSGMTELFVYNQTTAIGKRNIHVMKPGSRMSIGGSKNDDFFIFLVPFPANLAQIQYDGQEYCVSILKPEYFPYEKSADVERCIGRDITVVSKKGYPVTFTFRGYEDPMVKINTILTSI